MFNQGCLYDAVSMSLKFKVYLFAFKGFFIVLDEPFSGSSKDFNLSREFLHHTIQFQR